MDNGYKPYYLRNIKHIIKDAKKHNKIKDRQVYIVGDTVYKIIDDGLPEKFWDVLNSGFYKEAAPILLGVLFDEEKPVGYVAQKCDTLHIGRPHLHKIRYLLKVLYLKTGFVFSDFHSMNFGQFDNKLTILDLESVISSPSTKDKEYQLFINQWK